jgi:hypothetical protein
MKKISILSLLLLVTSFISCSSDESDYKDKFGRLTV